MTHKVTLTSLFLLCTLAAVHAPHAQSVTSVEVYGPVAAAQVYAGLGTNISDNIAWEWPAFSAIHGTWARFDCPWNQVEAQIMPGNTSGGYSLPPACAAGLANAAASGVHPIINALYGPPYYTVLTGKTTASTPNGSTTVTIGKVTSGSIASVMPGRSGLRGMSANKVSYWGDLITAVSGNTLTLASALNATLPAGYALTVNLLLYPPVFVAPGGNYATNPSIIAYGNYVHYLETQIAAAGLTGQVSLWNEPTWGGDYWEHIVNAYDKPPRSQEIISGLGVEIALYASTLPIVPGVTIDNGYTETVGAAGSLLFSNVYPYVKNIQAAQQVIGSESFHPYGKNPEDQIWNEPCLAANASMALINNIDSQCSPVGSNIGSSYKTAVAFSMFPAVYGGISHAITETGLCRNCYNPGPSETQITRFSIRQFLAYEALNISPIDFFKFSDYSSYEWCSTSTSCYPIYTAFGNLMNDIGAIAGASSGPYPVCMVPTVSSYAGYFPLATVTFVGAAPGASANSLLFYTWQRSYTTTGTWQRPVPSPTAVNVSVAVPVGSSVASVKDMVTSTALPFAVVAGTLTYAVSDDPIEVLFTPNSSSSGSLSCD